MLRSHTLLALTMLLAGCGVGSLSQTFPETAQQNDARLLGTWLNEEHEQFVVTAAGTQGYQIAYTDADGRTGRLSARLGQIGRFRALDVMPDKEVLTQNDTYSDLLLPLHTVLFIDSIGAQIRFRMLEPDSLDAMLKRDPTALAHVRTKDLLLLTAEPAALQSFLGKLADRPGMLGEESMLYRKAVSSTNALPAPGS